MWTEAAFGRLPLEGPLREWELETQYGRRNSGLMPTKSAVLGICCAALGISRGSDEEAEFLVQSARTRLLAVAVPRILNFGEWQNELSVRRITDYHTVGGAYDRDDPAQRPHIPVTAERKLKGQTKQTVLTWRQYLCDSHFVAILSGQRSLIECAGKALADPVWGIWLGRKACIPTAPIYAGVWNTEEEALRSVLGDLPLDALTHQREVDRFEDGTDTLPDQPVCFAGPNGIRRFAPRRVRLDAGKGRT